MGAYWRILFTLFTFSSGCYPGDPVGIVVWFGGHGEVSFYKSEQDKMQGRPCMTIRSQKDVDRRVLLYAGWVPGGEKGTAYVSYVVDNRPYRWPNPPPGAITAAPRREVSRTFYGRRPQGGPNGSSIKAQLLFGTPSETSLYVPPSGPLGFAWFVPKRLQPAFISVESGGRTIFREAFDAAGRQSPVLHYASDRLRRALIPLLGETRAVPITLSLEFSTGAPLRQELMLLPKELSEEIDFAFSNSDSANKDDPGWFLALDELASSLEKRRCGANCADLLTRWWRESPENYAANAAMLGLSARSNCGSLEAVFTERVRTKERAP
jgi:hypothetical protein